MKLIPLSKKSNKNKGKYFAMVDDEDFERVNKISWAAHKHKNTYYAVRNYHVKSTLSSQTILMHRFILNPQKGQDVDHIDRNGLNNQRKNIRPCTRSENMFNRKKRNNVSSSYKGVCFDSKRNKWTAELTVNKKRYRIGRFKTEENAAIAYNIFAEKHHGEFALLNTYNS